MLSIPIIRDRIYVGQLRCCPGFIFTSHKYLLSYPISYERKNKNGDDTSTVLLWVAEFRFGKCLQAYFFSQRSPTLLAKKEFANPFFAYLYLLHY